MRSRILILAMLCTLVLNSPLAKAAPFRPTPKDVCTLQQGEYRLDLKRLVAKLLDQFKITGWMIDTTGGVTPQAQLNAVYLYDYCKSTGHCDKSADTPLAEARTNLRNF